MARGRGAPPYRQAYNTTSSDVEAARFLGFPTFRFTRWRRSRGLPSRYKPKGRPARPDVEANRRRAYESTETDAAAAAIVGISREAFAKWRELRGLPARTKTPRPRATEDEVLRWFLAWEMTNNDREAGALLGMTSGEFNRRRRRWLRVPATNVPTIGHRGRLLRGHAEESRMGVYRLGLSDKESAMRLGISRAAFQGWRTFRGLPAARQTECGSCGAVCLPRSPPKFCSRCKRELAARRKNRWLNDGAFRARVRSLEGKRVSVRYFTGRRDRPFAGIAGELTTGSVGTSYVLVGRTRIPKRRLCVVRPEYEGEAWDCGCGCGATKVLTYIPSHGPPFFLAGHNSRTPAFREKARRQLAQYRGWNQGLHGEAFWSHYSAEARAKMLRNLERQRRRAFDRATHVVHDESGHVYVRVPGTYPSGAARIKARARIVMEESLGRPLGRDEYVAHLNGVADDDRIGNLHVIRPEDRPALAWGAKRGLKGADLVRWILEHRRMRDVAVLVSPREARRQARALRKEIAPRIVSGSPLCSRCGMLRTTGGACLCASSAPAGRRDRVPLPPPQLGGSRTGATRSFSREG